MRDLFVNANWKGGLFWTVWMVAFWLVYETQFNGEALSVNLVVGTLVLWSAAGFAFALITGDLNRRQKRNDESNGQGRLDHR